mgnify:CR=1 FL=1
MPSTNGTLAISYTIFYNQILHQRKAEGFTLAISKSNYHTEQTYQGAVDSIRNLGKLFSLKNSRQKSKLINVNWKSNLKKAERIWKHRLLTANIVETSQTNVEIPSPSVVVRFPSSLKTRSTPK